MPDIIQEIIPYTHCLKWMNTIQLIVDYADRHQLSELVRVISTVYEIDRIHFSVWRSSLDPTFFIPRFSPEFFLITSTCS